METDPRVLAPPPRPPAGSRAGHRCSGTETSQNAEGRAAVTAPGPQVQLPGSMVKAEELSHGRQEAAPRGWTSEALTSSHASSALSPRKGSFTWGGGRRGTSHETDPDSRCEADM